MSKELNVAEVATLVADKLRTDINDGKLLTAKAIEQAVDGLVAEKLGSASGLAGLTEVVKASVLQAIPKGSVFMDSKAKGFDPEQGIKGLGRERLNDVKAELAVALMPKAELTTLASRCGISADALAAARTRVLEGTQKTLSVGTGSAGGFAVPEEFVAEVQRKLVYASVFRSNVRNWSGVGLKGSIPRETGTVTIGYEGELAQPSVTDLSLGQVTWSLNKRFTLMALSGELFRFSPVNFIELLATMVAEQNRVKDDSVFFSGSGSGQPTGLRTIKTGMNSTSQAGADLDYDDLVNLKHKLPVQYRNDGSWLMMNNDTLSLVAKMKDNQGRPLFLDKGQAGIGGPNIPAQTIGFVLGLPVVELNSILNTYGAGGDTSEIWHLNRRGYSIFDGGSMEFATSDQASDAFLTDKVYARAISFDDGKVNIPEACAYITGVK